MDNLPTDLKSYRPQATGNSTLGVLGIVFVTVGILLLGGQFFLVKKESRPASMTCEQFGKMSGQKVFQDGEECRVIIGSSGENVSLADFMDYLREQKMKREPRKAPAPEKQTF